jgi:histidinol dehydrogenase
MPIRLDARAADFPGRFRDFLAAKREASQDVEQAVRAIIADVRARGDRALFELSRKFDRIDLDRVGLRVTPAELAAASAACDPAALAALELARDRIEAYHRRQVSKDDRFTDALGVELGHRWTAIEAVGLYVPGGTAAYPSSVLMNAVPAKVAGSPRLVMVVPAPDGHLNPLVLAAAELAGVDEIYRVGGAQAVAALAYGTETIAPVDKIVGPGNSWVTGAKLLVSSRVGIDLPAGPSEVVLIADATADHGQCTADLLAQAEHGDDSEAILLALDPALAAAVRGAVDGRPNVSVEEHATIDEALARSEEYAPEHLELWVEGAEHVARRVRNAGTVFVRTSAVVGDYAAGATHVLPTGGLARGSGGLGLESFLKPIQVVTASAGGLERAREIALPLARVEGLPLHAAALEAR